jgi:Bacterial PH domain
MSMRPGPSQGQRVEYRPRPSAGARLGFLIATIYAVLGLVAISAMPRVSESTRLLAAGLGPAALGVAVVGALGALHCSSLTYVLNSSALEIRSGFGWLRIRYELIEAIGGGEPNEQRAPVLWPGACFGRLGGRGSESLSIWRATSIAPGDGVVIVCALGERVFLTPADPTAFKEELIQRARNAARGSRRQHVSRGTWIDQVTKSDEWLRLGIAVALGLASFHLGLSAWRGTSVSPGALAAGGVILVNALLGYTLLRAAPGASRVIAGATLCAQLVSLVVQ